MGCSRAQAGSQRTMASLGQCVGIARFCLSCVSKAAARATHTSSPILSLAEKEIHSVLTSCEPNSSAIDGSDSAYLFQTDRAVDHRITSHRGSSSTSWWTEFHSGGQAEGRRPSVRFGAPRGAAQCRRRRDGHRGGIARSRRPRLARKSLAAPAALARTQTHFSERALNSSSVTESFDSRVVSVRSEAQCAGESFTP